MQSAPFHERLEVCKRVIRIHPLGLCRSVASVIWLRLCCSQRSCLRAISEDLQNGDRLISAWDKISVLSVYFSSGSGILSIAALPTSFISSCLINELEVHGFVNDRLRAPSDRLQCHD